MTSHCFRRVIALGAVFGFCAIVALPAHAQAWVPQPGTGTVSLDYQLTNVKYHLFSQDMSPYGGVGSKLDLGKIDAQTGQLGIDYGLARNLGLSVGVAYVGASYRGTVPESGLDDGKFHGTLQDVSAAVRYMVPWRGITITPNLGFSVPTHEYQHHGHAAIGKGNKSINAGIAVGRALAPWASNVWVQGGYARQFVPDVQQWGLDVNTFSGSVGWFVLPQLSLSGYYTYFGTEGGIDWYWADFSEPGVGDNHDRAAKSVSRRAGGTLSYQFGGSKGLFVDIGGLLSGANTHDGMTYTVGTNWSFVSPFAH